ERVYDHPNVKVGRDPAECNLVFNQSEWPMVSRRHAEFRFKNGRCLLVDTNSSFGTFLNGRRISEPVEIQPGARVQFGAGGPLMIVARVDVAAPPPPPPSSLAEMETRRDIAGAVPDDLTTPRDPAQRPPLVPPAPTPAPQQPTPSTAKAPPAPSQPATIELVRSSTGSLERIPLTKDVTRLGREPGVEVAIEAAAAVVSRRHAEIQRRGGQYLLVDLGSFNGTLLNEQRITAPTPLYDGDRIQLGM